MEIYKLNAWSGNLESDKKKKLENGSHSLLENGKKKRSIETFLHK